MAKNLLRTMLKEQKRTPGRLNTGELIKAIESGYLVDNKNGFKKKKSFSPSTLVYGHGACPRYWYLAFHGGDFVDSVTPQQVANMRNGSLSHERIQKAMEDSGILSVKEKKIICDDPPIFGYCDAELEWDGGILPAEIKTTTEMSFNKRKEMGNAATYHIAQLLMYMYIEDHDMGVVIYENKNTHELFVVPVEMDDDYRLWLTTLFEWMRTVKQASDNDLLPKKTYRANSKVCKSCPLLETCSSLDPAGDIEIAPSEMLG